MFKLADDLDEYNVPYQWINYSEIGNFMTKEQEKYKKKKKKNAIWLLNKLQCD